MSSGSKPETTTGLPWSRAMNRYGHAHHVSERGEDHLGTLRDRDRVVLAAHRDHADGAAWPVHQLDLGRQEVLDAVLVDGVGMAPAHLHELVVAARLRKARDPLGQ